MGSILEERETPTNNLDDPMGSGLLQPCLADFSAQGLNNLV
jgi:hypothetical protein